MGRNTTAMKRGWNYDKPNAALKAMVDGAEAFKLTKDSANAFATYKVGTAYEVVGSIIDGYGVSLATGYSASASNRLYGIEINADTGSTDVTGDTYVGAIRGRTVIGTTQTNASIMGVLGQIDVGSAKNIQGNFFGIDGVLDFYANSTAGSGASFYAGAGRFTLWNEGTTTVGAGGVLCGIDICQNSGKPTLGSGAVNPAVHIRSQASKQWQFGLYMLGTAIIEAVRIGAQANTDGSGVPINGTNTATFRVFTDTASTDIAGAVDVRGGLFRHLVGTTQTNSSQNAFRGQLVIATGKNIASGNYHAVRGYLEVKGTTSITGASTYSGALCAYVEHGGTTTIDAGNVLCGLDCYQVGSPTNNGINSAINIRGTFVAGFSFPSNATCISANAAVGGVKKIAIDIGGSVYYINTYLIS